MFTTKTKTIMMLTLTTLLNVACAPNKQETKAEDPAISAMSSQLQSVGDEYLPASVDENGSAGIVVNKVAGKPSKLNNHNEDVCAGSDFVECQPKLIRMYLRMGRESVYTTQKLITDIARHLSNIADGSTGEFTDEAKNLRIIYSKRSSVDFDVISFQGGVPGARISSKNGIYNIQFDSALSEKENNRGGKIDIKVTFTDRTNWDSQITITGVGCNTAKPDDPENARLHVNRRGEVWKVQSMFYNGIAGYYQGAKSCSIPASDSTGLVVYSDMVADKDAAKAGIYILRRNEQSSSQLQNYGMNAYCQNYPDLCQALAIAIGQPAQNVATHLSSMQNNYCVVRGTSQVLWNNNCSSVSPTVAAEELTGSSAFLSPYEFYNLKVVIPTQL